MMDDFDIKHGVVDSVCASAEPYNTYRLATQGFVWAAISSVSGNFGGIRSVNKNLPDENNNVDVTSISSMDYAGDISQINADLTALEGGIPRRLMTDKDKSEIGTFIQSVSGEFQTKFDSVCSLIPDEADERNKLADKNYVLEKIKEDTFRFRGNWSSWEAVPENAEEYPEDELGRRTPGTNDYIVVEDCYSIVFESDVNNGIVGLALAERVLDFEEGHIVVNSDISRFKSAGITSVRLHRNGSWRFKYIGEWESFGKSGWVVEYSLSHISFTDSQWDSINSGINSQKVTAVEEASGRWDRAFTGVRSFSADWQNAGTEIAATSANNRSVYATVESASGRWNGAYTKVANLSADWQNARTEIAATSANNRSVYATVESASSNWQNAFTTAESISARSNRTYSTVSTLSGRWQNASAETMSTSSNNRMVYATVSSASADWQNARTEIAATSANNRSVYSSVSEASGSWDSAEKTVSSASGNWENARSEIESTSADNRSVYSLVESASSNWDSVYATVESASAEWGRASTVIEEISAYAKSAYSTLSSTSGDWENSCTEIESTSASNRSVYSTVSETSGNWQNAFNKISSTSGEWDNASAEVESTSSDNRSVYSTVESTSGNWENARSEIESTSADNRSVYSSVSEASGSWDSVYSTVESASGRWKCASTEIESTSASNRSVYSTVSETSGDWENSRTEVEATSANNRSVYSSVSEASGSWDSVYSTVESASGNWENARSEIESASADSRSVYASVFELSGRWENARSEIESTSADNRSVYSTVSETSGDWNSTCLSVRETSGDWNKATFEIESTSANNRSVYVTVQEASGSWDSAYLSVKETSGDWNDAATEIVATSANNRSVYSSVSEASGSWDSVYSTVHSLSGEWGGGIEDAKAYALFMATSALSTAESYSDEISSQFNKTATFTIPYSSDWNIEQYSEYFENPVNGDEIVLQKLLFENSDKFSRRVYRYSDGSWISTDGEQDTRNLFFTENLTTTFDIGNVKVGSCGSATIAASGHTITEIFKSIFVSEKEPSAILPDFELEAEHIGSFEVGTRITPRVKVHFKKGSYSFGPESESNISCCYASLNGNDITITEENEFADFPEITLSDEMSGNDENRTLTAYCDYNGDSEDVIPVSNIGTPHVEIRIVSGSTDSKTYEKDGEKAYLKSFRRAFYGYKNSKSESIDSSDYIRTLGLSSDSYPTDESEYVLEYPIGAIRAAFAYPKSKGRASSIRESSGFGANIIGAFKLVEVDVDGVDGYGTAIPYYVYYKDTAYSNDSATRYILKFKD